MDYLLYLWFFLLALSLIFMGIDLIKQPIMGIQKLGWILVTLYIGILGLIAYLLTCRSPNRDMHSQFIKPLWRQAANSEVHCVAGDATGIIIAAIFISFYSISTGSEIVIEYITAFILGWVIFQAGMMRNMYPSYTKALTKTFFAETVSMNMVMIGMIPTMLIFNHYSFLSTNPLHLLFWFKMGLATIIGSIIAYPANYLLVKHHLKHGCMTVDHHGDHSTMKHHHHQGLSRTTQSFYCIISFLLLLLVTYLTLHFLENS